MFDLHNVLWVVPGVIFIHIYNIRRPGYAISLSGWPYLFFLVIIACVTWLPAEFIIQSNFLNSKIFLIDTLHIEEKTALLLIAIIISISLFLIAQLESITKRVFTSVEDNFYKKCIEWENKFILLSLKNNKAYIGILWKYPENPKSRHESQTISIAPCISGYRDGNTKKVIWNTYYPEYKDKSDIMNMEVIIPRSEIITFGKFNKKTFEHFYKDNSSNEDS